MKKNYAIVGVGPPGMVMTMKPVGIVVQEPPPKYEYEIRPREEGIFDVNYNWYGESKYRYPLKRHGGSKRPLTRQQLDKRKAKAKLARKARKRH